MSDNTPFRLQGARSILSIIGSAPPFERHIAALERAVDEYPDFAFDLSKSLVESICKTILADRGQSVPDNPSLPTLLNTTLNCIPLIPNRPTDNESPTARAVRDAVGGLNRIVGALAELRNIEGATAHGRDIFRESLDAIHAQLTAGAADTVVHFLYHAHRINAGDPGLTRIRYDEDSSFNDFCDQENETIRIFEQTYLASWVLYETDFLSYISQRQRFCSMHVTVDQPRTAEKERQAFDEYIDSIEGPVTILGTEYKPSEVLRRIDRTSYDESFQQFLTDRTAPQIDDLTTL